MSHLLLALGVVLMLGGLGHSAGVTLLYMAQGVPEIDRVLLDAWVAEAHIIGGAFYLAAFRARRAGAAWRGLSVAGALTVLAYALPFIPVLFIRAPAISRVPTIVYALLSVVIVWRVVSERPAHPVRTE